VLENLLAALAALGEAGPVALVATAGPVVAAALVELGPVGPVALVGRAAWPGLVEWAE
jgi:hypothetical protein